MESPNPAPRYPLCALFRSLQGEATWSGRAMVFVRFSGCPLSCPWCDEPLHRDPAALRWVTLEQLHAEVEAVGAGAFHLLLTGGEPLAVAGLQTLVTSFKRAGYWIALETSGVGGALPGGLDWVTLSPKTPLGDEWFTAAHEIKYVVGANPASAMVAEIVRRAATHPRVWVQPRSRGAALDPAALASCLELVWSNPERLRLSLQTHKLIGIP